MVGKIVAVPVKTCFITAVRSKPPLTGLAGIFYSFIKLCYLTDNNRGILTTRVDLSHIDLFNEANCTGLPHSTDLNKSRAAHATNAGQGPMTRPVRCVRRYFA